MHVVGKAKDRPATSTASPSKREFVESDLLLHSFMPRNATPISYGSKSPLVFIYAEIKQERTRVKAHTIFLFPLVGVTSGMKIFSAFRTVSFLRCERLQYVPMDAVYTSSTLNKSSCNRF